MTTASQLADAIGRKEMADALGVGPTAVSNAVVRGEFPASWFLLVKSLADQAGHHCPPDLFKMRLPTSPNVDATAARQAVAPEKVNDRRRKSAPPG